jgi:hypothetical protein
MSERVVEFAIGQQTGIGVRTDPPNWSVNLRSKSSQKCGAAIHCGDYCVTLSVRYPPPTPPSRRGKYLPQAATSVGGSKSQPVVAGGEERSQLQRESIESNLANALTPGWRETSAHMSSTSGATDWRE